MVRCCALTFLFVLPLSLQPPLVSSESEMLAGSSIFQFRKLPREPGLTGPIGLAPLPVYYVPPVLGYTEFQQEFFGDAVNGVCQ